MVGLNKTENKQVTVSFNASGFPLAAFKEWTDDCNKRFGGCRWVKMMHDHQLSHIFPLLNGLMSKIEQLEQNLQDLARQPVENEEENEPKTFGSEEDE